MSLRVEVCLVLYMETELCLRQSQPYRVIADDLLAVTPPHHQATFLAFILSPSIHDFGFLLSSFSARPSILIHPPTLRSTVFHQHNVVRAVISVHVDYALQARTCPRYLI